MTAAAPEIKKLRYVSSEDGVIVILNGRHRSVSSHDEKFEAFRAALLGGAVEQDLLDLLDGSNSRLQWALTNATDLLVVDGAVTFKGRLLPTSISARLQKMLSSGYDLVPLSCFMSRLAEHPSPGMMPEIYDFLESSQLPLTRDGFLVAYAVATKGFTDPQTNLHDLRAGRTCEIPRSIFDDDLTPPRGLRFYTFSQMPSGVEHAMLVQIDPADITLVDQRKSRSNESFAYLTCRYAVLQEDVQYSARKTSLLNDTVISLPLHGLDS